MPARERVLVIAAHPDDEVLGCGGTIARLARAQQEVSIVILGEGVSSRYPRREQADARHLKQLHEDCRKAARMLGAKRLSFHDQPDNRFDTVPLLELVKFVERHLETLRPRVVYTHHPGDLNIDHALTFRAVLTATRPMRGCPVTDLLTFEIPSSTDWAFQRLEPTFRPNVFTDISVTIETKMRAMRYYKGERRVFPHPRSPEALRASARRWGSVVGVDYAEPFELIRSIH